MSYKTKINTVTLSCRMSFDSRLITPSCLRTEPYILLHLAFRIMILLNAYLRTCKTRRSHSDCSFYGNHKHKNTRKIEGCVQNYGCMLSVFLLRFFLKVMTGIFPADLQVKGGTSNCFSKCGVVCSLQRDHRNRWKHTLLRVLLSPK